MVVQHFLISAKKGRRMTKFLSIAPILLTTIPFHEVLVRSEIYFVGKEINLVTNKIFFVINEINFVTYEINFFTNEKYYVKSEFYM